MSLKNRPKTENYDSRFQENLQNLVEHQSLGKDVKETAEAMVEDIPITIRQHYEPKHMAAGTLVISSRIEDDPRTIKQLATSLQEMKSKNCCPECGSINLEERNPLGDEKVKCKECKEIFDNYTKLSDQYSGNHVNEVRRCMKKLRKHKDLDLDPVLADDFLDVILEQIEAEEELKKACYRIMEKVKQAHCFYGKSQIGLAAGVVYMTSKREKTVKEIAADKLSEIAARNRSTIQEAAKNIESEVPVSTTPT